MASPPVYIGLAVGTVLFSGLGQINLDKYEGWVAFSAVIGFLCFCLLLVFGFIELISWATTPKGRTSGPITVGETTTETSTNGGNYPNSA